MASNAVTERDFRKEEFKDAKVEDYEKREDGAIVRKDRWESTVRSVAFELGFDSRKGFECAQVKERVEEIVRFAQRRGWRPGMESGVDIVAIPMKDAVTLVQFLEIATTLNWVDEPAVRSVSNAASSWLETSVLRDAVIAFNKLSSKPIAASTLDAPPAMDTTLLDYLAEQALDLRCFDIPTGQGDANVGWRVIMHAQDDPRERVASIVHDNDPREAIRRAMARLEDDPYCKGELNPGPAKEREPFTMP